jgi:hypothetical protein
VPYPCSRSSLTGKTIARNQPSHARRGSNAGGRATTAQATCRSILLAAIPGHQVPLALMILFIVILLTGALLAVVLVSMARRDDRVDAIHAVAEVLRALLPWSNRHRRDSQDSNCTPEDR